MTTTVLAYVLGMLSGFSLALWYGDWALKHGGRGR